MTRPIYEPSLPRTDAMLGYGSDQLFRRPARAAVPLSLFRAVQTDFTQTIVANGASYTEMRWDCWENCDSAVFDENFVGNRVSSVDILAAGIYAITVRIVFDAEFTGNFRIIVNDWGDYPGAAYYDHNSLVGQNGEQPVFSVVRSYPPPSCLEIGQSLPTILIQVNQWSAGNIDTAAFGSSLEIVRLGSFGDCTPMSS